MPERRAADAVRARILRRAGALFERRGFSPVTMEEIASDLGMSKKTLYQHFPDGKVQLARTIMERSFAELEAALAALGRADRASARVPAADFGERLQRYAQIIAESYRRLDGPLLADLEVNAPDLHDEFVARSRLSVERNFGALLAAGMRAGAFRRDLDPRLVIAVIQSISRLLSSPLVAALGLPHDDAFRAAFAIVLDGVRVHAPARARPGRRV